MRILIVCPDRPGINAIPEVRLIQSWHHTSVLNGTVTPEDIYTACRETAFDIIHFAAHGGADGVQLSNGLLFDAEDIAQVARLKESEGLMFNSCETGVLANYAVRHGPRWAVSADGRPEDAEAWKLPCAFYGALRNGHAKDFVGAFELADNSDGTFGLRVSPSYLRNLQRSATLALATPHSALALTRREAMLWGLGLACGTLLLSTLLARLAGG